MVSPVFPSFGLTGVDYMRVILRKVVVHGASARNTEGSGMWNLLDHGGQFPSDASRPVDQTSGGLSVLFAEGDDEGALGWQERALCAQTDPEAFFLKREDRLVRQNEYAPRVTSALSAWNMRWPMMNVSVFGVVFPNVNGAS